MYEHHVLKLNAIYCIYRFLLRALLRKSIFTVRKKPLDDDARALVFAGTGDGEWHFIAISLRDLFNTIHIGMVARDERDIRAEAHRGKRRTLGYRVKDKRQIAERNLETLRAVMRNNHFVYCSTKRAKRVVKMPVFQYPQHSTQLLAKE